VRRTTRSSTPGTQGSTWAARRLPSPATRRFAGVIQDGGLGGGTGGALVITGGATQVLGGVNTYTGATTIGANSTLRLDNAGSIAASSGLNLTGAFATFNISAGGNKTIQDLSGVAGSSVVLGDNTLSVGTANSTTFAGVIAGSAGGGLVKQGSGTLTLQGNNTYTGSTTINGGTLAIVSDGNLGAGGALTFNGGTLQLLGSFGTSRAIALAAGGGTIDTNGNNLVVSSAISGAGGLVKNGAGTLNFQTAMTYTGGTTVNAGTLFLDSVGGAPAPTGALTVNGGTFDMSDIATGQTVGALSGAGGIISLGANALATNSSSNTTLATQIIGTGALIKQGNGVLTLTGNSLYSGGTTISGGLINFVALNNFGTGTVTLNGGGLQWATGNTADISSRLVLGAAGATFDTGGNNVAFATGLTGAGGITKQGNGILNLAANNTYTGPTSVTGGTLAVNGRSPATSRWVRPARWAATARSSAPWSTPARWPPATRSAC
jgi:autotransporter-associated beta strand protein